jgi:hypothetical protein
MLGRLRMSIDQCQEAYLRLFERIFNPRRAAYNALGRAKDFLQADGRFDSRELEDSIKEIIKGFGASEEALLQDADPQCKVCVACLPYKTSC